MLTTIDNIKAIRDISNNLKDGRIAPYIKEVEDTYVMPQIGADLYEKLDTGAEKDDTLLYGGYYDGHTGREYCHGITSAVAYYAYARVLRNNQINVTAFGVTQKQTTLSTPHREHSIDDAATEAKKMGDLYMESCIRYLHRNDTGCCQERHKKSTHYAILH